MKILVTGAAGMLGRDLTPCLAERHETIGVDLADFDLTDQTAVCAALDRLGPAWVVNCAAYTAVDRAESEPEKAAAINETAARVLAAACAARQIRLLHLSTDYVFDGRNPAPYPPDAPANPLSVYGRTKRGGETAVLAAMPQATILRTAWLYGPHGPNFVAAILRQLDAGQPLRVVADQVGSPTYTVHLAAAIRAVVEHDATGIHHATNAGFCSWREFARAIAEETGRPDTPIEPLTTAQLNRPAPRPANSRLDTSSLTRATGYSFPDWRAGLREYLRRVGRLA
ncbi:MAG: dTDP-4-dehydrorhamnose reductase [Myxococcales bacterium]|nr:dTDP-4-dehydrorhamnose reductase [Myxococcales bacterium]